MKSIKFFAVASAVALLSTTGFTSCNQKNAPDGPGTYNGETVKTQFSISIPEVGKSNPAGAPDVLRMPAANTQDAGNFLGMDNIMLMPFNTAAAVAKGDTRLGNIIVLSNVGGTGAGNIPAEGLTSTAKYKVYSDVSIPLGTNHFLFYAHGLTPALSDETLKFQYGQLTANNVSNDAQKTPAAISFDLVGINIDGRAGKADALAAYLTTIANSNDGSTDAGHTWATYSLANGGNDGIKALYDNFITLKAGSAMSVLKTVEDLYNSMETFNDTWKASHVSNNGVVYAVMTAILAQAEVASGDAGARVLAWKDGFSAKDYPRDCSLPDGAAAVNWQVVDGSHATPAYPKFEASTALNYNSLGVSNPASYAYPACLYYYTNSTLETSTKIESTNYGTKTWATILSEVYTQNVYSVGTSTRSVAIVNPIQYGVARLNTSVVASTPTLKDYKEEELATSGTNVDVTKLTMTAVLVGGQGSVGYDFVPASAGSQIVYDKILTAAVDPKVYTLSSTTATQENPTMLLETVANEGVRVAIEFENGDQDFFGEDGKLIPKGTRFYVVGLLNSSSRTATGDGNANKVFEQDFTTTATFTISSLKHAYNVVPDLRTEKLELGFSVDLTWKTGNTYSIEIDNY